MSTAFGTSFTTPYSLHHIHYFSILSFLAATAINIAMSAPGDFDHLSGTQVSFDDTTSPPQAWVIDEKITEDFQTRTQAEVDEYGALPYAVLKFACHNAADPREKGFMRIYIQIPITGTMLKNSTVRAQQATQGTHEELTVLKSLADQGCSVVPRLLAYNVGQQDGDGCVPGGYINHVVWARVSGTPIDEQVYWDRAREYRDKIRDQFRKLYE